MAAQTYSRMSVRKPVSGQDEPPKVAVETIGDENISVTKSRLSAAMELLSVGVASVLENDEIICNTAFARALDLSDPDPCQITGKLHQSVIAAVQDDLESSNITWLEGKRSFDRDVYLETPRQARVLWRIRVCGLRFNQTSIKQLQLLQCIEQPEKDLERQRNRKLDQSALRVVTPENTDDPSTALFDQSQWNFQASVLSDYLAIRTRKKYRNRIYPK